MSAKTGIYRVAQFIKWTSRTLGGLFILGLAYSAISSPMSKPANMIFLVVLTVGFMAIAEGIAWVIEGFSRD